MGRIYKGCTNSAGHSNQQAICYACDVRCLGPKFLFLTKNDLAPAYSANIFTNFKSNDVAEAS